MSGDAAREPEGVDVTRRVVLIFAILFGLAVCGWADRPSKLKGRHLPYAKRVESAWGSASSGTASVESYDCSHEQSGFIAVNPCTGNDITEEATVACRGTLSVRPDGVVVDADYNTKVSSIWTDTGTGEVFELTGSGLVVFTNANSNDAITVQFKGRARGRRQDIAVDWHGLIAFDGQTGEVTEVGVPGPSFSDGLTCVNRGKH
jgi:hypothetical protein